MPKITPLHDNVIVKPLSKEEITKSGIVLPETLNKEKPQEGEIVAVGPGRLNEKGERMKVDVKVGQKVLFKKYSPDEFEVEGEDVLVMREDDIIAVLE